MAEVFTLRLHTGDGDRVRPVDGETNLLEAMRDAGLPVRKSCRNGVCGLCKCRLVAGDITYHWRKPHGLWDKHIAAGLILPCIAFAESDLVIDQIPLVETTDQET